MLTNRWSHLFFLSVSLLPFFTSDVLFPYIVGTESDWKIFFSTCFWPTTTCIFFVPSMVAGIRRIRGDESWAQLSSQLRFIRKDGKAFWIDLLRMIVSLWA